MKADAAAPVAGPQVPSVGRRLAAFMYEGVLLFGIVWVTGFVYGVVTNQRHALKGAFGLQATLFLVLGVYFVYFWSRQGQTLAMRTWRMRLVGPDGRPPGPARATVRYLLAWLWFLPALAVVGLSGLTRGGAIATVVIVGALAYASLARLRDDRQFLHDVVCRSRIIDTREQPSSDPPGP